MTRVLITGGLGFIGSNLAHRLLGEGQEVTILDNLSRPGSQHNLAWLRAARHPGNLRLIQADVRDVNALRRAVLGAERIYHLAGQVAVTTSLEDPRGDFEANALGTFNLLEVLRAVGGDPTLIYSSTNKVYGPLAGVPVVEEVSRYRFADIPYGISEQQPLDFHGPYGCSKGAADQYVRDYCRVYGMRTVVMRQSCIYGYRQFGVEDQGWMAWFMIAALKGWPITMYGNGKQVRDVLFVDDLLDAYEAAVERIDRAAGQIYNIGGGRDNALSVWAEFGPMLEALINRRIPVSYRDWRHGDQHVYISDMRKAEHELGWRPKIAVAEGIQRLFEWIRQNEHLFGKP